MKVGTFVSGSFKPLPTATYLRVGAESTPHQVYEARVKTTPMSEDQERSIIEQLMNVQVVGMVVLGVDANGDAVTVQVTGSPFLWAPFIAILPSIIVPLISLVIGIILVFRVPEWTWGALVLLLGGSVLAYAVVKAKG